MTTVTGELDRTTVAALQGCRYRYAPDPGCTATYGAAQKQGLYAHEKSTAAHALHRVTLRDCPECGAGCGDEIKRGMHLKVEHGIRAGSEKRQELDAKQVEAILKATARPDDTLSPAAQVPVPDDAQQPNRPLLDRPRLSGVFEPDGHPDLAPWANGHSPAALDLSAAQDFLSALLAEVETLRAENARLKADTILLAQIRDMLAQG